MAHRSVWLIVIILFFSACAQKEGAQWSLLGDTNGQAFFMDRQGVERLPGGNYRYTIKSCPYQQDQLHKLDDNHNTNRMLIVEMNCRDKKWTEADRSVMSQSGKTLFRYLTRSPLSQPVESDTIHQVAYDYLCGAKPITPQHNHQ